MLRSTKNYQEFEELCTFQSQRRAPIIPRRFNDRLVEKSVSNGKDDSNKVMALYEQGFIERFQNAKVLNYAALEWSSTDSQNSLEVLDGGIAPNLEE